MILVGLTEWLPLAGTEIPLAPNSPPERIAVMEPFEPLAVQVSWVDCPRTMAGALEAKELMTGVVGGGNTVMVVAAELGT